MYKNLPEITCYRLNTFYNKLFGGNPGNVIFSQILLKDDLMFKLSQELGFPETAFVSNIQLGKIATMDAAFFTMNGSEVNFCGHLALGTVYAAYLESNKKNKIWVLKTKQGSFEATLDISRNGTISVTIESMMPKLHPITLTVSEKVYLQTKFGVSINSPYQAMISSELETIFIQHDSLALLNFDRMEYVPFVNERNLLGVVFVNCSNALENKKDYLHRKLDIEIRASFPGLGIKEDPQSGSVQSSVVEFALYNHLLKAKPHYVISQGSHISREGSIEILVKNDKYWIKGSVAMFHISKLSVF